MCYVRQCLADVKKSCTTFPSGARSECLQPCGAVRFKVACWTQGKASLQSSGVSFQGSLFAYAKLGAVTEEATRNTYWTLQLLSRTRCPVRPSSFAVACAQERTLPSARGPGVVGEIGHQTEETHETLSSMAEFYASICPAHGKQEADSLQEMEKLSRI